MTTQAEQCAECGSVLKLGSSFCGQCGSPAVTSRSSSQEPDADLDTEWRVEVTARRGGKLRSLVEHAREKFGEDLSVGENGDLAFFYVDDIETAQAVEGFCELAADVGVVVSIGITRWSPSRQAWVDALVVDAPGLAEDAAPLSNSAQVLVSTTFEIPGCEIIAFHGAVFGLVVRSRNLVSNWGAGAKGLVGGELHGLTRLLTDGRNDALARMRQEALERGANAVVGLRYDSGELARSANEVVAYGTAVTVRTQSAVS